MSSLPEVYFGSQYPTVMSSCLSDSSFAESFSRSVISVALCSTAGWSRTVTYTVYVTSLQSSMSLSITSAVTAQTPASGNAYSNGFSFGLPSMTSGSS